MSNEVDPMTDPLDSVLFELEQFGKANDTGDNRAFATRQRHPRYRRVLAVYWRRVGSAGARDRHVVLLFHAVGALHAIGGSVTIRSC